MKTYRKIEGERASEFFVHSLRKGGIYGPEVECGYCSRVHWCVDDDYAYSDDNPNGTCITEAQAKELLLSCENQDSIVLNREFDCIEYATINDMNIIIDCPCNGLRNYENFIWGHKDQIRKYLKLRIDQEFIWAEEQKTINRLKGIG